MAELRGRGLTRRGFLGASAAALAATAVPSNLVAQGAKYRRYDISGPNLPTHIIDSYKKAIGKMLALPPTDPLNWYRHAIIHTLDCPHGNWWFLPWHRAYLGWFERTCRELSGDPEFALPYWDWTTTPRVPPIMFDGVLDPNNHTYIPTFADFKSSFEEPVGTLFANLTAPQVEQLVARGYPLAAQKSAADFWNEDPNPMSMGVPPMFFKQGDARGLAQGIDFDEDTKSTVLTPMIGLALREPIFAGGEDPSEREGFGSAKFHKHLGGRKGILETGPHDHVHGGMGGQDPQTGKGFMVDLLSRLIRSFFCTTPTSIGCGTSGRANRQPKNHRDRHCLQEPISLRGRLRSFCSSATRRVSQSLRPTPAIMLR